MAEFQKCPISLGRLLRLPREAGPQRDQGFQLGKDSRSQITWDNMNKQINSDHKGCEIRPLSPHPSSCHWSSSHASKISHRNPIVTEPIISGGQIQAQMKEEMIKKANISGKNYFITNNMFFVLAMYWNKCSLWKSLHILKQFSKNTLQVKEASIVLSFTSLERS